MIITNLRSGRFVYSNNVIARNIQRRRLTEGENWLSDKPELIREFSENSVSQWLLEPFPLGVGFQVIDSVLVGNPDS